MPPPSPATGQVPDEPNFTDVPGDDPQPETTDAPGTPDIQAPRDTPDSIAADDLGSIEPND